MTRDGRPCAGCREGQGAQNGPTGAYHRAALRVVDDPAALPEALERARRYFARLAATNHEHDADEGAPG